MSRLETQLTKALGIRHPLIVAPMAGGPSSVQLIVASCQAGALGSIGAAYSNASAIKKMSDDVRTQTNAPLAINLFIPHRIAPVSDAQLKTAVDQTASYRLELGIPTPTLAPPYEEDFDSQFEAVLSTRPQVLSFIFGLLEDRYLKEARKLAIYTMGTATSLEEALRLEASGVDAVIAQGFESGGHRGIFDSSAADPELPVRELVRSVKSKIKVPVIAAGGIMSRDDIQTVLKLGADAVQMGTAFLATREAGTSAVYRKKLLETGNRTTKTTRAFSGRLARGITNRFMAEVDSAPNSILPFPAQNKFTRDLRNASTAAGSPDFLSLWSGSGRGELWTGTTGDLIQKLFE